MNIPTALGVDLRRLGGILDGAPSIQSASYGGPFSLMIPIDDPAVVHAIAEALGVPIESHTADTGRLHTSADVASGLVVARIFSITDPEEQS